MLALTTTLNSNYLIILLTPLYCLRTEVGLFLILIKDDDSFLRISLSAFFGICMGCMAYV